jgi:hypothetical protein
MLQRIIIVLFFLPLLAQAQQREDARFWASASYSHDLNNKWTIGLDNEARWENNASRLGRYFFEPGVRYNVSDLFRVQLQYRFIRDFSDRWWGNRNRVSLDAIFRIKKSQWRILLRTRFQYERNGYGFIDETLSVPEIFLRQSAKVNYKINRFWEPFVSTEGRVLIQDDGVPGFIGVDRFRLKAGTDYNLSRKLTLGAFIMMQQEVNRPVNDRLTILGIELTWNGL